MEKWKNLLAVALVAALPSVWAADANRATLSADVKWSAITWEGGSFNPSLPIELTLTKAVVLTFDKDIDDELRSMSVKGGYRLTLVPTKVPPLYDFETDGSSSIAIQGGTSSTKTITWGNVISINGKLITTGYLRTAISGGAIVGSGTVVVESGSLDLRNSRWELNANLALELCGGATIAGTGDGFAAIDLFGIGSIRVAKGASTSAKITAPIRFRGDSLFKTPSLTIDEGASLTIDSVVDEDGYYSDLNDWAVKVGGQGSLVLNADAELPVAENGFCAGGVTGAGELVFSADPTTSGVAEWFVKSEWNGTCAFRGATINDFNPVNFGNANSKISFLGTECAFVAKPVYAPALVLAPVSERYLFSLAMSAPAQSLISLDSLSGSGKLIVRDGGFRVFAPRSFTGSLVVDEGSSGVIIGANTEEHSGSLGYGAGQITVIRGTSEIASGSTWEAANGIFVAEVAGVYDRGEILGAVKGGGKVIYDGDVPAAKPESAARFTDSNSWSGTVNFVSAQFAGSNLALAGNDASTVIVEASSGRLAGKTIPFPVQLRGDGLKVTEAINNSTVTFSALSGNGALTIASGNIGLGSAYKVLDVSEYSGSITVTDTSACTLILGEAAREADGVLQIADGMTLKSKRKWTAYRVIFGRTVYVDGKCGDALMKVTGPYVDFNGVKVHLLEDPVDVRRCYKLVFDGSSKQLVIAESISPPTVDVTDVDVVYGTDFTNTTVRMSLTNYWSGYEFSGGAIARFKVFNQSGVLVGAGDVAITGDGTVDVGCVGLPYGRGSDFRYEVDVVAIDAAGSDVEIIKSFSFGSPAVRPDAPWFYEDAVSFATNGAYGAWTYRPGDAYVTNDSLIAVRVFDDGELVSFKPDKNVTNDLIRVQTEVIFDSAVALSAIPVPTTDACRLAGITVVYSGNARSDVLDYAVWIPDEDSPDGGEFTVVHGSVAPTLNAPHKLEWTINYATGMVSYSADGVALTNSNGIASFRIPAGSVRPDKSVCYTGAGYVDTLAGAIYNAMLAAVVRGDETNQYYSVEEAVAATREGGKVLLLWDATWKPSLEDVGRVIEFDFDGRQLTLDAATTNSLAQQGYGISSLGDGRFRVDAIEYVLSFDPNTATAGKMDPVSYSVTNMVFDLPLNRFEKEGFDFVAWNRFADGSGASNWTDGATIDMSEFGLTNVTLYAQWETATRYIVVEAADEFVYIESVLTNGVPTSEVRYFQKDASKATGTAAIRVLNGSELVVRFSTDIEKRLTFEYVKATEAIVKNGTIEYKDLPQVYEEGVNVILDPIHEWAASRGISFTALSASAFSQSSYGLDLDKLLTSGSEVVITDFAAAGDSCSFKVTVDGRFLGDASRILPMIRVSDDLDADEWCAPEPSNVSVGGDGTVTVSGAKFVKIVIPENG